jgi:hypothetical protein
VPRFYFHVEDHVRFPDLEGTVLDGVDSARIEAVRVAGAMLTDHAVQFWQSGEWRVIVTDEDQQILFCLRFEADAPSDPPKVYHSALLPEGT